MKSKKLLLSTFLLLGGITSFMFLSSNTGGITGRSTIGCGGAGCHAAGTATTISVTGIPAAGFTAGSTYTITLKVMNSTKAAAGFDLTVTSGTISGAPSNTMVMGGTEMHHTSPQMMTSGISTWVFNWMAPTAGNSVVFNVAGNAVNNTGSESGDAYTVSATTFAKAIPASVETIEDNGFSLYPNPSTDEMKLKSMNSISNASFTAVSLTGAVSNMVANKISNTEYQLSTSSLAAGQYILHFEVDGKKYSQAFSKK